MTAPGPSPTSLSALLPDLDAADGDLRFLLGSLFNQQVRSEQAWKAPSALADRLGGLDTAALADSAPDFLADVIRTRPALHPMATTMASRTVCLCGRLVDEYAGRAANVWADEPTGRELLGRLTAFAGIGHHKATVVIALLAHHYDLNFAGAGDLADRALSSCPRLSEILMA